MLCIRVECARVTDGSIRSNFNNVRYILHKYRIHNFPVKFVGCFN